MDKTELQSRLAGIDLFQGMPKRALKQVVNAGRETTHADGHEVITEGTGAVGFHLIISGQARVTSGESVRRTLGVGDYFGEISVIDGQPRSASVEAVGELRTFLIHPHVLKTVLDENPEVAHRLLVMLCKRLREAELRAG
ncbi:MAG: family transcriptional regulator, cyclic receptor protein [Pseudonocardiales bacterium]|nr:cyclic nucleotide-binding protein [Pseudonocardiales bacterium]MDT4908372.1 family transcriptional regulator, cyclic receptor protein [Pseudonocardiales bacterium]MDT4961673.1 family transcriptional regulator, cyclic receptor protein [Pseudonocardiales bacterium]MDT4973502.1 family transcriptional regulator, cyclic receptor protein [Pseudonocardiales bacterium]MDT4974799.1 family transcriptional regulator, cyclic receptor protein [Pseudonocardiales bacterium]